GTQSPGARGRGSPRGGGVRCAGRVREHQRTSELSRCRQRGLRADRQQRGKRGGRIPSRAGRNPDARGHVPDRRGRGGGGAGSVVDHLASQGSLSYDRLHGLLYAVNAGSDTVSVFAAFGDRLALRQVVSSGGTFPVSVTVHGNYVYVLNALNGGSVYGYRVSDGLLSPIPGSLRGLGLNPAATPQFTNTPGQVAFIPDGSALIVTTKANGNDVDVFSVLGGGLLSASPVVNSEPGAVPLAVSFDPLGHVLIA